MRPRGKLPAVIFRHRPSQQPTANLDIVDPGGGALEAEVPRLRNARYRPGWLRDVAAL
jgi:hypothetical protein